jgi:hypothetical protein
VARDGTVLFEITDSPKLSASTTLPWQSDGPSVAPHATGATIQWVFTAQDLASCNTAAYALRHLRAELGQTVSIVASGIDVDEADVRPFLRVERLDVELVTGSARSYERQFHTTPTSGLFVLWNSLVVRGFPTAQGRGYPSVEAIGRTLQSFPSSAVAEPCAIAPDAKGGGGPYGLWRDFDGNPWCGGACGSGQACCNIVTS